MIQNKLNQPEAYKIILNPSGLTPQSLTKLVQDYRLL